MSMDRRSHRRLRLILAVLLLVLAGAYLARHHLHAAVLIARMASVAGWPERTLALFDRAVTEDEVLLPIPDGPLRARLYRPEPAPTRAVVLVTGVHAGGIDDPRIRAFARQLASARAAVLTPDLPHLRRYEFDPATAELIEAAGDWLASRADLTPEGRIGLIGASFGGGLSIVAGGRPRLRDRLAFIVSVGGHGDLPRVLQFLCTGRLPDGSYSAPHDYGVVIILLNVAHRLVPADQVGPLRDAIRTFLSASHLAMFDEAAAQREFDRAMALEELLPEPSATLMRHVNRREAAALGARLLPHLDDMGRQAALSPERSPAPRAPVYLLHGAGDDVIPPLESRWLARYLESHTRTRVLITPLLTHAEVQVPADVREIWRVIAWWAGVLGE
jgi:dienelactone hydrolase